MRIVEKTKIKSGTWGYITDPNGYVLTGYVSRNHDKPYKIYNYRSGGDVWYTPHIGVNVLLEGAIKVIGSERGRSAAGATVEDLDGHQYYMSIDNVTQTLKALAEGTIKAKDGFVYGHWTLTKQGTTVSLTPYNMEQ